MDDDDLMPEGIPRPASERFRDKWRHYAAAITDMDAQIDRVLETLDDRGLADDTVVIYLSDNGFMMGRRGIDSKVCVYEDSIRIPMTIRAPMLGGGGPSGPNRAPVSSLDVPPTILALAGVEIPKAWPGRDLTKLVATGADDSIDYAVSMWPEGESRAWGHFSARAIRSPSRKLIVHEAEGHADEFYHIDRDPHEERNLAADPEHEAEYLTLKRRLRDWLTAREDTSLNWPDKWDNLR